MKCGYCTDTAVAWITPTYIRHPKPTPVCAMHLAAHNKPDNFGVMPAGEMIAR